MLSNGTPIKVEQPQDSSIFPATEPRLFSGIIFKNACVDVKNIV